MFTIGEEVKTYYTNPPVSKDQQYSIGQEVEIMDLDTHELLARFVVDSTDHTQVIGVIVWVKD